jgi:hypothetical protein
MAYTPVFRLNPIGRVHVKTGEVFRAADPWNGDRPSAYTVEHYVWARGAADMYAIWSDADDVERFLPDSLCDLYRHGQVPAASLPHLLKSIEPGLVRSDYLGLYQSAAFRSGAQLYAFVFVILTLLALFIVVMTETPRLRAIAVMICVIGVFGAAYHWMFRRKLNRRAAQQARLRALAEAQATPASPAID